LAVAEDDVCEQELDRDPGNVSDGWSHAFADFLP
jgi:hypothetical protein